VGNSDKIGRKSRQRCQRAIKKRNGALNSSGSERIFSLKRANDCDRGLKVKHVWKTGAFVKMRQQQVDRYYTRYSETATN
jgi:hypothetical protein